MVGDRGQAGVSQVQSGPDTEQKTPPKTPSSVSLAESTLSASHSEPKHENTDFSIFDYVWKMTNLIIIND